MTHNIEMPGHFYSNTPILFGPDPFERAERATEIERFFFAPGLSQLGWSLGDCPDGRTFFKINGDRPYFNNIEALQHSLHRACWGYATRFYGGRDDV